MRGGASGQRWQRHWKVFAAAWALFLILAPSLLFADPLRPQIKLEDLEYIVSAEIVSRTIHDHPHTTLLIRLAEPMTVISTLEGVRERIRHVGNSHTPPALWALYERIGLKASRRRLLQALGRDGRDTSLLFTGVNMEHLSIQRRDFEELVVYALVTAGVRSNAVRMAADTGAFYEPGTINIIILVNRQLTPGAMQQAIVVATEAKTAALWDMDIRSSQTPLINPATGTGTDNIIVVQGAGPGIEMCGGHTKTGELIARAVYAGVQESIFHQNGIKRSRPVVERLQERRIPLSVLAAALPQDFSDAEDKLILLLAHPTYVGFLEAALSLSDQHERGLLTDLDAFRQWCTIISTQIAGRPLAAQPAVNLPDHVPPVLKMALEALLAGSMAGTP